MEWAPSSLRRKEPPRLDLTEGDDDDDDDDDAARAAAAAAARRAALDAALTKSDAMQRALGLGLGPVGAEDPPPIAPAGVDSAGGLKKSQSAGDLALRGASRARALARSRARALCFFPSSSSRLPPVSTRQRVARSRVGVYRPPAPSVCLDARRRHPVGPPPASRTNVCLPGGDADAVGRSGRSSRPSRVGGSADGPPTPVAPPRVRAAPRDGALVGLQQSLKGLAQVCRTTTTRGVAQKDAWRVWKHEEGPIRWSPSVSFVSSTAQRTWSTIDPYPDLRTDGSKCTRSARGVR